MYCMRPRSTAGAHCVGVPEHVGQFARTGRRQGHKVVVGKLSPDDVAYGYAACTRCGAWSTTFIKNLEAPCPPPHKRKRTTHCARIMRCQHPQSKVPIGEPVPFFSRDSKRWVDEWEPIRRARRRVREPIDPPHVDARREWPCKKSRTDCPDLPAVCGKVRAIAITDEAATCDLASPAATCAGPASTGGNTERPAARSAGDATDPAALCAGTVSTALPTKASATLECLPLADSLQMEEIFGFPANAGGADEEEPDVFGHLELRV